MARRVWAAPLWFDKPVGRILFLRELEPLGNARQVKSRDYPGGFSLEFTIQPEGISARRVTVSFSRGNPHEPHVRVDGPSESPHRYGNGELCMWYPYDPPARRWTLEDGAGALVAEITAHLLREEWYRETGEWVGEEVKHVKRDPLNDPVEVHD